MQNLKKDDIELLQMLRKQGKYTNVLDPSLQHDTAWRVIALTKNDARKFIPNNEMKQFLAGKTIISKNVNMPVFNQMIVNSWTVNFNSLLKIIDDWGCICQEYRPVFCLLKCNISSQKDAFLLNPRYFQQMAQEYAYQKETWQIANVNCDIAFTLLENDVFADVTNVGKYEKTLLRNAYYLLR